MWSTINQFTWNPTDAFVQFLFVFGLDIFQQIKTRLRMSFVTASVLFFCYQKPLRDIFIPYEGNPCECFNNIIKIDDKCCMTWNIAFWRAYINLYTTINCIRYREIHIKSILNMFVYLQTFLQLRFQNFNIRRKTKWSFLFNIKFGIFIWNSTKIKFSLRRSQWPGSSCKFCKTANRILYVLNVLPF